MFSGMFQQLGPIEVKPLSAFADVKWGRRALAGIGPTRLTVVNCFRKWEVSNAHGKEILTWEGATEMYWTDERLVGYPKDNGVPD